MNPEQAYPYCEADKDNGCESITHHIGKGLLEEEAEPGYLSYIVDCFGKRPTKNVRLISKNDK